MSILVLIPSNVFSAMPAPVLLPVFLLLSFFSSLDQLIEILMLSFLIWIQELLPLHSSVL
jgi:hypothetical protein